MLFNLVSNFTPDCAANMQQSEALVIAPLVNWKILKSVKCELEMRNSQFEKDPTIKYNNNVPCIVKN